MRSTAKLLTGGRTETRGAFTLVELLVVIGIIGLLISILLPALGRARQQANVVACESNLREIGQALVLYTMDNQGVLPFGMWDGGWNPNTMTSGGQDTPNYNIGSVWDNLIEPELTHVGGSDWQDNAGNGMRAGVRKVFVCPDAQVGTDGTGNLYNTYVCHPRLMPQMDSYYGPQGKTAKVPYGIPYKLSQIKRSAEVSIIWDGALQLITGGTEAGSWQLGPYAFPIDSSLDAYRLGYSTYLTDDYALDPESYMTPNTPVDLDDSTPLAYVNTDSTVNAACPRFRHLQNTEMNALMVDGHVNTYHYNPKGPPGELTDWLRGSINVNFEY